MVVVDFCVRSAGILLLLLLLLLLMELAAAVFFTREVCEVEYGGENELVIGLL